MVWCLFGKRALRAGQSELPVALQVLRVLKDLPGRASLLVLQDLPAHLELAAPQGAVDRKVHVGLKALADLRVTKDLRAQQARPEPAAHQELQA